MAAYTAYTFEVQNNLLLMPYTGMFWTRSDVTTPTPKNFMQVEGGLSFAETSIQATAYVKGVYKEGSEIKGKAVALGESIQFVIVAKI